VDSTTRYLELSKRGREAFLDGSAPAAIVRRRSDSLKEPNLPRSTVRLDAEETMVLSGGAALDLDLGRTGPDLEVYPLSKKPGAPFADMITVGRTANNDVVLNDVTISRFHAYFKQSGGIWRVCDAGSKNGSSLLGNPLEARKEMDIRSGQKVAFGDVETTFYTADELFGVLQSSK